MHVTLPRSARLLATSLALLLAAAAQAQLKTPGTGSASGTGLKAAPSPAPAPAPPPAPAPAAAMQAPAPAAQAAPAEPAAASTTPSDQEQAASIAAAGWLTLLDRQDWGTSWETTAAPFRNAVPLAKWMDGVSALRKDMGPLVERTLNTSTFKKDLPGLPKGDYVTVLFLTKYEKREVQEVVTMRLEPDGRWRASGYLTR